MPIRPRLSPKSGDGRRQDFILDFKFNDLCWPRRFRVERCVRCASTSSIQRNPIARLARLQGAASVAFKHKKLPDGRFLRSWRRRKLASSCSERDVPKSPFVANRQRWYRRQVRTFAKDRGLFIGPTCIRKNGGLPLEPRLLSVQLSEVLAVMIRGSVSRL